MMMTPAQAVYAFIMMAPDLPVSSSKTVPNEKVSEKLSEAPCGLAEEGLTTTRYHDSDDPARCSVCRDDYEQRMKGELDG